MLEFKDAPLQDVVDALSEKCGVPMQIDYKALEEVGIGSDEGVTATLGGESLGDAPAPHSAADGPGVDAVR